MFLMLIFGVSGSAGSAFAFNHASISARRQPLNLLPILKGSGSSPDSAQRSMVLTLTPSCSASSFDLMVTDGNLGDLYLKMFMPMTLAYC